MEIFEIIMLVCGILHAVISIGWFLIADWKDDRLKEKVFKELVKMDREDGKLKTAEEYILAIERGNPFSMPLGYWVYVFGGAAAIFLVDRIVHLIAA